VVRSSAASDVYKRQLLNPKCKLLYNILLINQYPFQGFGYF
jgi:hypothetical protein